MNPVFLADLDPPGMESYSSGEAELAQLLSHPAAIAMVLSTLPVALFPPRKGQAPPAAGPLVWRIR